MSGEIRGGSIPGATLYAQILNSADSRWNGSAFEAYVSANYSTYNILTAEQGNSGIYIASFPTTITTADSYEVVFYAQQGASPAEGDPIAGSESIEWTGTEITTTPGTVLGTMSGTAWLTYVLRALKRTDKNTEIFDATKDCIDDIRRRLVMPEDETEIQTTDTISTLGDYRINLEEDFGLLVGDVFVRGTDTQGWVLNKITKREFDEKYSIRGTDAGVRSRPKDYCIFAGQIWVGPVPDVVSYVYKINYTQDELSEYSTDSLSIPFTDRYRQILRWGILSGVYGDILKNDDQAAKFGTLFENGLAKIEKRNDRNRTGTIQVRYQGC